MISGYLPRVNLLITQPAVITLGQLPNPGLTIRVVPRLPGSITPAQSAAVVTPGPRGSYPTPG